MLYKTVSHRHFFIFALALTTYNSCAQFVDSLDFKHYSIKSKSLGEIKYHVYNKNIDKKLPVVLFLQGSMDLPLIGVNGADSRFYTFNREILQYADRYHLVFISKPGQKFTDEISISDAGFDIKLRPIYNQFNTQEWRVNAASQVIDKVVKLPFVSKEKIIVIGYSEGGQIVPELTYRNKAITHLVSINGAGLNQFYDAIINERMRAHCDTTARKTAQKKIDSLFSRYDKIYANNKSLTDFHDDESYQRWSSYTEVDPLEFLKKIKVPILVIASGNDENSPILGLDYIKIEFLRLRKTNLSYLVYPDSDHSFYEYDNIGQQLNKRTEVYREIFKWIDNN